MTADSKPTVNVWCCGCGENIQARLTDGAEVYPHRPELAEKPLWRCDACGNHVGCHARSNAPLGSIPTPELRKARRYIHVILDPIWKQGKMPRGRIYAMLSAKLGRNYHTAELNDLAEARLVFQYVREIAKEA